MNKFRIGSMVFFEKNGLTVPAARDYKSASIDPAGY
jgi:hypothetical protein